MKCVNPGVCENARFYFTLHCVRFQHNTLMLRQSRCETGLFAYSVCFSNFAIYLRYNGPKFSDVQITMTEKICDCRANSPEITESLPGCYNGTRVNEQSGREFASGPAFCL